MFPGVRIAVTTIQVKPASIGPGVAPVRDIECVTGHETPSLSPSKGE